MQAEYRSRSRSNVMTLTRGNFEFFVFLKLLAAVGVQQTVRQGRDVIPPTPELRASAVSGPEGEADPVAALLEVRE